MQTQLATYIKDTPAGRDAEMILQRCTHCGFCNAACPTYRLLGDELEAPRGRIYLIKQLIEGAKVTRRTQLHLDHCLTCLSCESACPAGVQFNRLLDVGREVAEQRVARPPAARLFQRLLLWVLPHRRRFAVAWHLGRLTKRLLPRDLRRKLPVRRHARTWPKQTHARRMLVLGGCVQATVAPDTNADLAAVLDRLGISLIQPTAAGCCGAITQHLGFPEQARAYARHNIDIWWPFLEEGIEAIIAPASGCGLFLRDYGHLLQNDPVYAERAAQLARHIKDPLEVLEDAPLAQHIQGPLPQIVFHAPCTLEHGLHLTQRIEALLKRLGFTLQPVQDNHLCCGAAGAYTLMQPTLSYRLLESKIANLVASEPKLIATANIGCQIQLQSGIDIEVVHWVQLLARHLKRKQ